jgi:hypothetical protein
MTSANITDMKLKQGPAAVEQERKVWTAAFPGCGLKEGLTSLIEAYPYSKLNGFPSTALIMDVLGHRAVAQALLKRGLSLTKEARLEHGGTDDRHDRVIPVLEVPKQDEDTFKTAMAGSLEGMICHEDGDQHIIDAALARSYLCLL